ncbi:MAG: polysaccharide export protein [Alphaproteobacteria bacterium]|nr:polysaccharide export protein [Alphaproteobacteria bacterium]MBU1525465.1 polysaccharide export protein [Alphaproteobacteria bacterium]MBU2116323.1 polysaccharide export protein [Alphaproteobacteria bacterium]MBU2350867.1 polysaccharide export protein [Alphaproteobacteria bacterium]MBU2381752.1 polysaccharide export protein [Alphaproteobacteria bacterium]
MRLAIILISALFMAACASGSRAPSNTTSVQVVDPWALQQGTEPEVDGVYRIGPADLLRIAVFQVPDLSFDKIRVDSSGNVQMPLIGSVQAAGLTASELSDEIGTRLAERYLRNPQVTVTIEEAASQKVTVDGAVTQPGVYEMRGRTTLLQAVAMARGPLREADIKQVAVFREVDGQRMVAVFNLEAIRDGRDVDPTIYGDDIIVVDISRLNALAQDAISALPALAVFRLF